MKVDEADRTRPFAYADPRSLSQAWYDALYGSRGKPQPHATSETTGATDRALPVSAEILESPQCGSERFARANPPPAVATQSEEPAYCAADEDLETALLRARFKDSAPVRRANAPQSERTDLEIDDGNGTAIKLLIAQRGADLEVVAVCKRESRERAADALARARIALGARGIVMHTEIREKTEGEAR